MHPGALVAGTLPQYNTISAIYYIQDRVVHNGCTLNARRNAKFKQFFLIWGFKWKGMPKLAYGFRRTELVFSCLYIHMCAFLVHSQTVNKFTDLLNRMFDVAQPVYIATKWLTKFYFATTEVRSICFGSDSPLGPPNQPAVLFFRSNL